MHGSPVQSGLILSGWAKCLILRSRSLTPFALQPQPLEQTVHQFLFALRHKEKGPGVTPAPSLGQLTATLMALMASLFVRMPPYRRARYQLVNPYAVTFSRTTDIALRVTSV